MPCACTRTPSPRPARLPMPRRCTPAVLRPTSSSTSRPRRWPTPSTPPSSIHARVRYVVWHHRWVSSRARALMLRVSCCRVVSCAGLDSPWPSTVAGAQVPSSRRGTAAGAALRYRGRQPTQAGTLARAGYARHVPPMPHSSIASERAGERISRRSSNERTN